MSTPRAPELKTAVADGCMALADLLDHQPPDRWDTPSLCTGWRVREVVAHLTMPVRYSPEQFQAMLADCAFDFTALSDLVASRDGQLPPEALVADLRSDVLHQWLPPGGGVIGALIHIVVHGLDITVPLHEPRRCSDLALRAVLDDLVGGTHHHFGFELDGLALRATDLDWAHGTGEPVCGPAEHLALLMCGRDVDDALAISTGVWDEDGRPRRRR